MKTVKNEIKEEIFVKGIAPSYARSVFTRICNKLISFGYDIELVGDIQIISGDHILTQWKQDYKIKSCINDPKTTIYYLSDNAPFLSIFIAGYMNDDRLVYNLSAKIPYTEFNYWEGEDSNLSNLVEVFVEDAKDDIINSMSDYIIEVKELKSNNVSEVKEKMILSENNSKNYKSIKEPYVKLSSKTVYDSDGFTTDYTLYYDSNNDKFITIFGDEDLYSPEDTEPDFETSDEDEAYEWFNSYEGFVDWENRTDRFDDIESPYYNGDLEDSDFEEERLQFNVKESIKDVTDKIVDKTTYSESIEVATNEGQSEIDKKIQETIMNIKDLIGHYAQNGMFYNSKSGNQRFFSIPISRYADSFDYSRYEKEIINVLPKAEVSNNLDDNEIIVDVRRYYPSLSKDLNNQLDESLNEDTQLKFFDDDKEIAENIDKKLENFTLRIYEGLYKQINESKDKESSIEDLETKIDIIMDALGLENDKEEEDETEELSNNIEDVDTGIDDVIDAADVSNDNNDNEQLDDSEISNINFINSEEEEEEV